MYNTCILLLDTTYGPTLLAAIHLHFCGNPREIPLLQHPWNTLFFLNILTFHFSIYVEIAYFGLNLDVLGQIGSNFKIKYSNIQSAHLAQNTPYWPILSTGATCKQNEETKT